MNCDIVIVGAGPAGIFTALELVLRHAQRNKESYTGKADPKVLEVQRADETPVYQKVVGGVDLDTMIENAAKRQGGK